MRAWISFLAILVLMNAAMAIRPCPASAADNKESARQHFKKASQLYDVGRFDEALVEYEKAYSLHEDPSLLFNMAQTCRRKGDLKRATDLYKNYLVKDPETPLRSEVENRINALKAQIEQEEKAAASAQKDSSVAPVVAPIPTGTTQPLEPPAPSTSAAPAAPSAPPTPAISPVQAPAPVVPEPSYPPAAAPGESPPGPSQAAPSYVTPAPGYQAPPTPVAPPPLFVPAPVSGYPAPAAAAQQSSAPTAARDEGSSGWPLIITGSLVIVGGLVCVGLGVYNAVQTKLQSDEVSSAKTFSPSDDSQGKRAEKLARIELGVGIGAVAVGSILYAIGSAQRSSRQSRVAVVPLVQPDGALLAATGAF